MQRKGKIRMARSTIFTTLKFGTEKVSLTKMCPITSYPDLIGSPENIEVTDMDCEQQTFVPGVKSQESMEFEANYDSNVYDTLIANENKDGYFELEFGKNAADGTFEWAGSYTLAVAGGGVNEARKMKIVVTPSSDVKKKSA